MDRELVRTWSLPPPPRFDVIDGLAVEASTLDLGEVWEQDDYPYDLVIHNRNDAAAEIFDVAVSCGCVEAIEPRSLTLAPGTTATIRLKLNLAKRTSRERGLPKRPFEVEIHPLRRSSMTPQPGWRLHGVIKSRVTLDTLFLDFGDTAVRGQPPFARKVAAGVHMADARLRMKVVPDLVAVEVRPAEGSANRFDLLLAPRPSLPVGPFECKVHLDLETKDGERLSGVGLPVTGKMQPEVRAIPAQLVFGPRRIGQTAESTVTLQVPKGEDWVVDHIETDAAGVRVEPVAASGMPPGRVFRVRQSITKVGHQSSTIRFFVRKGHGDPVPLAMKVSYDGDESGVLSGTDDKEAGR